MLYLWLEVQHCTLQGTTPVTATCTLKGTVLYLSFWECNISQCRCLYCICEQINAAGEHKRLEESDFKESNFPNSSFEI